MEDHSRRLRSHQSQKKKSIEKTNDRISELPDAVLHYILSMMPMKFIVRTSILSRRWRDLWKPIWAYSTSLDFGAEFTTGQTREAFVATVNLYLQLHKGKEIQMLRFSFIPCNLPDAEKWIEFAVAKRVKELHIDFGQTIYFIAFKPEPYELLNSIFNCDSITYLNLSRCDFCLPLDFKGYTYLKKLHLSFVRVTDALFESMLANCPLLEELSLRDCRRLTRVKVSAPDLPLKSLTVVDCWDAREIEIFAPNLRSFRFYGSFIHISFKNISSLVDVLVNGICRRGYERDLHWITVLCRLEHVKILTLCNVSLEYIGLAEQYRREELPITFRNLQELQLLMNWYAGGSLASTYSFFKNCPCPRLEKLFIELPSANEDPSQRDYQWERLRTNSLPIMFDHLKVIKMNGFRGLKDEMLLVKFFLEKAIVLESLVLVAPQEGVFNMKKDSASESKSVNRLRKLLLTLAKVSSSDAQILVSESSEDDGALAPTHLEVYHRKG
ncbi:putative FBD-associated F-box protein At1g61330 [Magnolia sinica]|uniref:putative FBD-associated F-box protein At1g61330 n=1 Tax=Magnolia sinica TaxID=86752 RepID=UPI00265AB99F|nr:putative FBD-associated F-box protein At1g61330 [Magnolia sinica]XP_058073166.1 putative FBD-associated F-box protein At1g61330 [Magnolia sinica]XP_058073167.1 putative FBD-associated F-box protein At1g61330 [Magnolia sinica]